LTQCLEEIFLLTNHDPTYIILNALDECPNASGVPSTSEQVLQPLNVDLSLPNLCICVPSRPEIDIRTVLERAFRVVSLHDQSGQRQGIGRIAEYLMPVVYSDFMMRRQREEDKNLVIKALVEKRTGFTVSVSLPIHLAFSLS
jgi:hypothetical protein